MSETRDPEDMLPRRDLCSGMAEIIKHAAIADAAMMQFLGQVSAEALFGDAGGVIALEKRDGAAPM